MKPLTSLLILGCIALLLPSCRNPLPPEPPLTNPNPPSTAGTKPNTTQPTAPLVPATPGAPQAPTDPAGAGPTDPATATTPATPGEPSTPPSTGTTLPPSDPNALLPFGTPVIGKKGFVYSPYAPEKGMVDVSDIPSGTKVECPYTQKIFRVP